MSWQKLWKWLTSILHFQKSWKSWLNIFGVEQDPSRACYGMKHVEVANERLAVQTLLITDELFRFVWYSPKIFWIKDGMLDCSILCTLILIVMYPAFLFNSAMSYLSLFHPWKWFRILIKLLCKLLFSSDNFVFIEIYLVDFWASIASW